MPRAARIKSTTGVYHVMLRGINRQNIFEDDEDKQRFVDTLFSYRDEMGMNVYAYCLMNNHVHLLVMDKKDELNLFMKKVACSYVYYFNWKYERSGHLFQDRYKSEPVETDAYLLMLVRYIHQNPVKAGIGDLAYRWSSYREYISQKGKTDKGFVLSLVSMGQFKKLMAEEVLEKTNENDDKKRLTDEKAIDMIKMTGRVKHVQDVQKMEIEKRKLILRELKEQGLSIRQISRLTGVLKGVVERA